MTQKRKTIRLGTFESNWPMDALIASGAIELERRGRWPLRYYVLVVRDPSPFRDVMTVWRGTEPMPHFRPKKGWTEGDDFVSDGAERKESVAARNIPDLVLSEDQGQQWGTRIALKFHGSGHYYSLSVVISIDFEHESDFAADRVWFREHVGDHFDLIDKEGEVSLWHHGTTRRWKTGARDGVKTP